MLNSTDHLTSSLSSNTNNNSTNDNRSLDQIVSSVPLPEGSPPVTPRYENDMQQQHHQQQQQQQQQPHTPIQQQHSQSIQPQQHTPLQFYRPQVFGGVKEPLSFSGLAKKADDVVGETLSQYGPGVGAPIPTIGQSNVNAYPGMMHGIAARMNLQPAPQVHPQQYNHYAHNPMLARSIPMMDPPIYNLNPRIVNAQGLPMSSQTINAHLPGFQVPASSSTPFQPASRIVINRSTGSLNVINTASTPTASTHNIICQPVSTPPQPVAPISPPLDALRSQKDTSASSLSSSNDDYPLPTSQLEDVKKRCENMTMTQVIHEHKSLTRLLSDEQKRRNLLESEINDLRRSLPGHASLETHPKFIRKKDLEKKSDAKCKDLNEAMKYTANLLQTKYAYTVQDDEVRQPLQHLAKKNAPVRAKMSTATPPPKMVDYGGSIDADRTLFDFDDGDVWCRCCDAHFKTMREYCEHMHTREHKNEMGVSIKPPWIESTRPPDRYDKSTTYSKLKGICSKLGNMLKMPVKVQDIDEVMYPLSKDREKMKLRNIDRERGRFTKDDRLFHVKGYDWLVPTQGFYCKLCHITMCDIDEAEEHLKRAKHIYEYTKFLTLQPQAERKVRQELERSRQVLQEKEAKEVRRDEPSTEKQLPKNKIRDQFMPLLNHPVITPAARAANEKSVYSARLPYKKPTSRIVDDHEVIKNIFEKRNDPKRDHQKHDAPKRSDDHRRDERRREGIRHEGSRHEERDRRDERKREERTRSPDRSESSKRNSSSHSSTRTSPSKNKDNQVKRKLPEILPVAKSSSSGALKKLRHDNQTIDASESEVRKERDELTGLEARQADEQPFKAKESTEIDLRTSSDDDRDNPATQTYFSAMEEEAVEDDESMIVKTVLRGDPSSPFPDLDLCVTGHTHKDALISKQLFQTVKVKMNRIDMKDYKDLLMPTTDLWSRVSQLITKKESTGRPKDAEKHMEPPPRVFLKTSGENVPVDVDESSNEDKGDFDMNKLQDFFCET